MEDQEAPKGMLQNVLELAGLGQKNLERSLADAVNGNHPGLGELFPHFVIDQDNPESFDVVVFRDRKVADLPPSFTDAQRKAVELVCRFLPPRGEVRLNQAGISRILHQLRNEVQQFGAGATTIPMTCTGPFCPLVRDAVSIRSLDDTGAMPDLFERDLTRCRCTLYETGVNPFGQPCQPPGTLVMTTSGQVPIEQLDPAVHRVWSWDKRHRAIVKGAGGRLGYEFTLHQRPYQDDLIRISAGGYQHDVTKSHISAVRFNERAITKFCVYLMRKGPYWRVGKTYLMRTCSTKNGLKSLFGPGSRASSEKADALWILGVYDSNTEALLNEEYYSLQMQTSRVCFADSLKKSDSKYDGLYRWVTPEQLQAHHERLIKPETFYASSLSSLGLMIEHPFWIKGTKTELGDEQRFSLNHAFYIRACNILTDVMDVPVIPDEPNRQ